MTLRKKAEDFATKKHKGKLRKFNGKPYITHPIAVAKKLEDLNQDEDVVSAGFLHDVLEDTNTTPDEIEKFFGSDVLDIILQLTAPEGYNGKKKKEFWNRRSMNMTGEALLIKLVDRLHNTISIVNTFKKLLSFKEFTIEQTRELINNLIINKKELSKEHQQIILEFAKVSGLEWNKAGLLFLDCYANTSNP